MAAVCPSGTARRTHELVLSGYRGVGTGADTRSSMGRFSDIARRLRAVQPPPSAGLETCRVCGRDFVSPVEWEPVDAATWWMLLRCGEWGTWREVTVSNAVAERYDAELDRRVDVLDRTLRRLDGQ